MAMPGGLASAQPFLTKIPQPAQPMEPGAEIELPGPGAEVDPETGATVTHNDDGSQTIDFGQGGGGLPADLPWDANLAEHLHIVVVIAKSSRIGRINTKCIKHLMHC